MPNSVLLKELILKGMGIGYINKDYIKEEIAKGVVVVVNHFKNVPIDNATVIYNSRINNPLINDFIKYLKITIDKTNS